MLGIVTFAVPMTIAAQQSLTPQATNSTVVESFRDFGGHYGGLLLAAFDDIPADKYGYRPTPSQQTIGFIAQHLENADYTLCASIGGLHAPTGPKDSLAAIVKSTWPKDTLVARLRASLQFCSRAFAQVNDARLADRVVLDQASTDSVTRIRALLFFTTDLAEHYSQIASYMRVIGLVPPSAKQRPDH